MKTLKFTKGSIPKGYKVDFDVAIFNTKAHRETQSSSGWRSFHLVREDKKLVMASVHFCVKENVAYSPFRAPFGAYEFSESLPASQLYDFMKKCEQELQGIASRIALKCAPAAYDLRSHDMQSVLLTNQKFNVVDAELGACISVDTKDFVSKIDPWEKRRLKQATNAKLTFEVLPSKDFRKVYSFIATCRKSKGYELSMTLEALEQTVESIGEAFYYFGVYKNRKLIAASISINVKSHVLYNFYSAHLKSEDSLSPMVYLISEMYAWCKAKGHTLVDLGTSALGGSPNFPLIDFKLRLGAKPAMKLFFEKELG